MKDSSGISEDLWAQIKESSPRSVGHRMITYDETLDEALTTVYIYSSHRSYNKIIANLALCADHYQSMQLVYIEEVENDRIPEKVIENCIKLPHHTLVQVTDDLRKSLKPTLGAYERLEEPFNTGHITDGSQNFFLDFPQFGENGTSTYATDYAEIGIQMHLMTTYRQELLDKNHFDYYRMGMLKNQMRNWEPLLRNQHICLFDANVLKKSELPAKRNDNPSGFTSEEASQLLRYAMVSPQMSFVFLYHIDVREFLDEASALWAAQALWYGIHGADNRAYEKPFHNENVVEFLIDTQVLDYPLSFIKSKMTGRWWVKIPTTASDFTEYLFLPCTETDYQQSRENRLPNRIVKAIARARV